jgi:hypothetical protein
MTLTPAPKELVRVMVGRAEILAPGVERGLVQQLHQAAQGDAAASAQARQTLKRLGRFAAPAFNRALNNTQLPPEQWARLAGLLKGGPGVD